jgi:hypothetical protein
MSAFGAALDDIRSMTGLDVHEHFKLEPTDRLFELTGQILFQLFLGRLGCFSLVACPVADNSNRLFNDVWAFVFFAAFGGCGSLASGSSGLLS